VIKNNLENNSFFPSISRKSMVILIMDSKTAIPFIKLSIAKEGALC